MSEKKHHVMGPSSMGRILECPGSKHAIGGEPGEQAELGTLIHECVENDVTLAHAREQLVGEDLELLELCLKAWEEFQIEVMPDDPSQMKQEDYMVSAMLPDELFGGTADLLIVTPEFIHVADLKTGQGEVNAKDNLQLASYLNLAREKYGPRERYYGTIVQPAHDYQETYEFSAAALAEVRERIKDASVSDDIVPGSHCRYCPLLVSCEPAQSVVETLIDETADPAPEPLADFPEHLQRWRKFVVYADVFEALVSEGKVRLLTAITEEAIDVPGYKAAAHGAKRVWANQDAAAATLEGMGLSRDQIFETKILSPAKIEKLGVQLPQEIVYQPPAKIILSKKASRKRAANVTNGSEFDNPE